MKYTFLGLWANNPIMGWIGRQEMAGVTDADFDRLVMAIYHWMPHIPATVQQEIEERLPRLGQMLTPEERARRRRRRKRG